MLKRSLLTLFTFLVMVSASLVACGGGDSEPAIRETNGSPASPAVVKDFSFEQEGKTVVLSAGQYGVLHSVNMDCRRNETRCALSDRFASLIPTGNAPVGNLISFGYKDLVLGYAERASPTSPWVYTKLEDIVITEPGRLEMIGWIDSATLHGQSGKMGISVALAGASTHHVTGNPNTLISAVSAGAVTEVTSEVIPPGQGPKKLGGIRVVCPSDAIGGCKMTMEVELSDINAPIGTAFDVYAGDLWWYSSEIRRPTGEKFILSSPAALTPGQVVSVSVQAAVPSGKIMIRELKLVTGDGFQIFMDYNFNCFEGNILTGGCKG